MNYHVHFDPTPDGFTCTVRALRDGAPFGEPLAVGNGPAQCDARDAAMAVASDDEVRGALRASVPDE